MKCPSCGRHLSAASSPFSDGGDFYTCKCGVEGYGYTDQDGYHVEFTIPPRSLKARKE
jgi:hypothetical protein